MFEIYTSYTYERPVYGSHDHCITLKESTIEVNDEAKYLYLTVYAISELNLYLKCYPSLSKSERKIFFWIFFDKNFGWKG